MILMNEHLERWQWQRARERASERTRANDGKWGKKRKRLIPIKCNVYVIYGNNGFIIRLCNVAYLLLAFCAQWWDNSCFERASHTYTVTMFLPLSSPHCITTVAPCALFPFASVLFCTRNQQQQRKQQHQHPQKPIHTHTRAHPSFWGWKLWRICWQWQDERTLTHRQNHGGFMVIAWECSYFSKRKVPFKWNTSSNNNTGYQQSEASRIELPTKNDDDDNSNKTTNWRNQSTDRCNE